MKTEHRKPIIYRGKKLEDIANAHPNAAFATISFDSQLGELFAINNPSLVFSPDFAEKRNQYIRDTIRRGKPDEGVGVWIYYPWRNQLIQLLPEEDFFKVRTARNRNLITAEEQQRFYNATIGIAGMSIGMSVALAIVLQGGGKRLKIADADTIDLSNLNRIPVGIVNLGQPKVAVAAQMIYEMNPFAEVEPYGNGLGINDMDDFFDGLDIVVDEVDNLAIKKRIREEAQKRKIPVVMAADCDTRAIVDVERYDREPQPEHFHGRLGRDRQWHQPWAEHG